MPLLRSKVEYPISPMKYDVATQTDPLPEPEEYDEDDEDEDADEESLTLSDTIHIETYAYECFDEWLFDNAARVSDATHTHDMIQDVTDIINEVFDLDDDSTEEWVSELLQQFYEFRLHVKRQEPSLPTMPQELTNSLNRLNSHPNPEQRTQAWYDSRYNLLTASNLWKALGSDAQKNSLIYEKCRPYTQFVEECSRHGNLSADNAMSWGQKYEHVSLQLYEERTKSRVQQYGCIVHKDHAFLGASPDGVVCEGPNIGRMVEIKNIVNREITGIPLEHYWIQMQIQMEVCDLDECDFVETRIKEYTFDDSFYISQNPDKGIVLRFVQRQTLDDLCNTGPNKVYLDPFYSYSPLGIKDRAEGEAWIQEQRAIHTTKYVVSNVSYWYLDQYSCVLVKRNREWFQAILQQVREIWDTIQMERVEGYEHRAPAKRKNPVSKNMESGGYTINMPVLGAGLCLVKLDS
jgi:putative phage-type endonuclease